MMRTRDDRVFPPARCHYNGRCRIRVPSITSGSASGTHSHTIVSITPAIHTAKLFPKPPQGSFIRASTIISTH